MKKLIINQKNLPRVRQADSPKLKHSDSSIRIRINKTQISHDTVPLKKSPSFQIQDIDMCLQILQKGHGKPVTVDELKILVIVQLLRSYKQTLTASQQLMTQSLRFSKLKFRTLAEGQEKQNLTLPQKSDKNNKQLPQSDQLNQSIQKPKNICKTPKNKRVFQSWKKNIDERSDQEHNKNQLALQISFNQEQSNISQSQQMKLQQQINLSSMEESLNQNPTYQKVTHQIQKLQSQVKSATRQEISLLKHQIESRNEEIRELNDRIQQLNFNIQNLIKRNSVKADEYNKLYQEYYEVRQSLSKIPLLEKDLSQIKEKCISLELLNQELERKKQETEKNWKKIEKQKNDKIQQQLGRYETAQQFYELTRRDLKQENQNLLSLLQERQREITHLYQVFQQKSKFLDSYGTKVEAL